MKHGKKLARRGDEKPMVAWDDRQAANSNEREYLEETKHPSIPYHKLIPKESLA